MEENQLATPWIVRDQRKQYDGLQARARQLALEVSILADGFPNTSSGRVYSGQLVRCGSSVAANHRAARRARSKAEWIAKMGIVEEEADEVMFWLGLSLDRKFIKPADHSKLHGEANEILSIVVASIKTARANNKTKKQG